MLNESEFRTAAEDSLHTLKQHLIQQEEAHGNFEVDEQNGVLTLLFEEPEGKFVITPNTPIRQIWISALSTSFKLDWDEAVKDFILPRTKEALQPLVDRLIADHLNQ